MRNILGCIRHQRNLSGYVVTLVTDGKDHIPLALEADWVDRATTRRLVAGWGWIADATVFRTIRAVKVGITAYEQRKGKIAPDRYRIVKVRDFARLVPDVNGNGQVYWRAHPKSEKFSVRKEALKLEEQSSRWTREANLQLRRAKALARGARALKEIAKEKRT